MPTIEKEVERKLEELAKQLKEDSKSFNELYFYSADGESNKITRIAGGSMFFLTGDVDIYPHRLELSERKYMSTDSLIEKIKRNASESGSSFHLVVDAYEDEDKITGLDKKLETLFEMYNSRIGAAYTSLSPAFTYYSYRAHRNRKGESIDEENAVSI